MKQYLDMLQPEFETEILQYEAGKQKEEQASALAKTIKKTRAKTGEAALRTFNRLRHSGTKGSQGPKGSRSNYRLYNGPMAKVYGAPTTRPGFALCHRYARE